MIQTDLKAGQNVGDRFVSALEALDAADMLLLRRSTGLPLGSDAAAYDLFHTLWRPLRAKAPLPKWNCYLLATLYPWHPAPGGRGSLGAALRRAAAALTDRRVRPRLEQLLTAGAGPPDRYLAAAIRLTAAADVPVDWRRFLTDLAQWYDSDRPVQRRWAEDYARPEKGDDHAR
jgi:CRISPR type I-E-associated protein CasB/Cse2